MQIKIEALDVIKTGQGQKGPWTLVKITAQGKQYSGFFYRESYNVGDTIDVELYQEEYNGKMQDKFKLVGKPKAAAMDDMTKNRIIQIESYVVANNTMLKGICKHLGVSTMGNVGNTSVPYPDGPVDVFTKAEMDGRDIPDLTDEDVPF